MAVSTFYINANTGLSDPQSFWFDDYSAFDGDFSSTNAFCSGGISSEPTKYLQGKSTNAPPGVSETISQVRFRVHYIGSGGAAVSSWVTLSAPTGGWDFSEVATLESRTWSTGFNNIQTSIYESGDAGGTALGTTGSINTESSISGIEIEVTHTGNEILVERIYFDGNLGITNAGSVWVNPSNAFDGNKMSYAYTSQFGSTAAFYLLGQGTTSDLVGSIAVLSINAQVTYSQTDGAAGPAARFYTAGYGEELLQHTMAAIFTEAGVSVSKWEALDTPTGGWSIETIEDLQVLFFKGHENSNNLEISGAFLEVAYQESTPEPSDAGLSSPALLFL